MFILNTDRVPETAAELTVAITESLRKWIRFPADSTPVCLEGKLPNLSSMLIDVSNGQIDSPVSLPFEMTTGDTENGPKAQAFSIIGQPISIANIPFHLELSAQRTTFGYARNPDKNVIATLLDAADGHLSIQISQPDLEAASLAIARRLAANHVAIQKVEISLSSISPTDVKVLLNITAKKFVTANIGVAGRIHIDDQMVATATDLKATAEGMVGNIAVNLLQPQLRKLENRPLPLLAFSLGNVMLRGVEIHTQGGLQISASFGSELP